MELLRRFRFTVLLMILTTLVACGGGDGGLTRDEGGGDDGGTTDTITITLALSAEQLPSTLTAIVLDGKTPLADTRVSFEIDDADYGFFTPEKGTATTDENGIANITLNSGVSAGTGKITAALDSGESAELFFNSQGASDIVVRIGSSEPDGLFNEGVAKLGLNVISAGATTSISIKLVDEQGNLYKESVDVNFTSVCAEKALPSAQIDKVKTTSSGVAEANYLAKGCVGDDPIKVNAIVNGVNLQATATLTVKPADVGSISFVSATPETIGIIGTGAVGGSESSTLVFKVLDTNGNPVNNQTVDFSLNTATGGVSLNPEEAQTNNLGLVQTVVNSGSVATTVRVNAGVTVPDKDDPDNRESDTVIFSQSSVLVISTGIPDQDSFSLSASTLNVEGWDVDGTEVTITARLADAFNNPVPDGTAINFTTEGGSIAPSCTTENGVCSVIWTSQYPRPEGKELHAEGETPRTSNINDHGMPNFMGQKYGGRVTILATAIGEESFPDLNGNGRFDECEVHAFTGYVRDDSNNSGTGKPCKDDGSVDDGNISYSGNDVSGNPYDLKEAFIDHNEDGLFNPSETGGQLGGEQEEFLDFDNSGDFTVYENGKHKDGKYNGVLCALNSDGALHDGCSSDKSVNVKGSLVLIMSGSTPYFNTITPANNAKVEIEGDGTASAKVIVADLHNQPMPAGTTVTFDAAVGSLKGISSYIWPNFTKNGGSSFDVTVQGVKDKTISGPLKVTVTTPSGVATSYTVAEINITKPEEETTTP